MAIRKTIRKVSAQEFEHQAWTNNTLCIGIDEAGRGCLAGPVVTVALALHPGCTSPLIQDSKMLSPKQRQTALAWIYEHAWFQIAFRSASYIDQTNILIATRVAMEEALFRLTSRLTPQKAHVLVDAVHLQQKYNHPCTTMYFGEQRSISIAAASIVAKEMRDAFMIRQESYFPQFSFAQHKGYGTKAHYAELATYGPSLIHRTSFSLSSKKNPHGQTELFR